MSNMAIEMGGKAGIVEADKITEKYLRDRIPGFKLDPKWKSDEDATFAEIKQYDVSDLSPQVACPHNVDNVKSVEEVETSRPRQPRERTELADAKPVMRIPRNELLVGGATQAEHDDWPPAL